MLRRACRLRNIIDKYCRDHDYSQFNLSNIEWRQIEYLVHLTKPFFQFTMALMKTKDVTIHSVFLVYRKLLEHIERSNRKLKKKTTPWKKDMYSALHTGRQKLREYYEKTYRDHGFLYGTGTLLAPQYKLSAFDDREQSTCHDDTSKRYCEYLRTCFMQYQKQIPKILFRTVQRPSLHNSELDRLLEPTNDTMVNQGAEHDEVDRYLREGKHTRYAVSGWPTDFSQRMFPFRHESIGKSTSVNSQCCHDLHAICSRSPLQVQESKDFSIVRETSAITAEGLYTKQLSKT